MTRRGELVLAGAVLVSASAPFAACAFDFDRYDPFDAAYEASTDDAWSNNGQSQDASADEARIDVRNDSDPADASVDRDGGSACSPSASCLQQATSCGATCGQAFTRCNGNMQACTSTEQSCLGRCATTCIGCTQDAGCAAQSKCLDAAHP